MGTRSMIAIQNPYNKQIKAVYCHWDGYLEHNGSLLQKYYSASPKANNLIALGDISSLKAEIGEKHAFSQFDLPKDEVEAFKAATENMCTFYTRDRGESTPFKSFPTLAKAADYYDGCGVEYLYVYKYTKASDYSTGEWHYKKPGGRWKKLAPAIRKLDPKECA
jgi:hypothetical protein